MPIFAQKYPFSGGAAFASISGMEEVETPTIEEAAKEETEKAATENEIEKCLAEALEKEKAAQDKYLRLFAEFENYRQRTAREQLETIATANGKLLSKLSEVKDNFERAFAEENKTGDLPAFEKGIKLIQEQFNGVLTEFGLEEINPVDEPFDPNMQEALMNQPSETVAEGNVVQVFQKGYKIKNKLLKTAKVIVSSGKPA